jgi:Spy/CpxP family protein refolding chaperone
MYTLRKHALIALTVLSMGSAAFAAQAQTTAPQGRPDAAATHQERMAKWSEHFARRQAKLHDALQLNGSQESAWATYQAAIKPQAMGMHGDRAAWATMPAPARMEQMIAMSKQRTAMMESHLGALNTFYAVLTPAQKKVFDENTRHRGHHREGPMKG